MRAALFTISTLLPFTFSLLPSLELSVIDLRVVFDGDAPVRLVSLEDRGQLAHHRLEVRVSGFGGVRGRPETATQALEVEGVRVCETLQEEAARPEELSEHILVGVLAADLSVVRAVFEEQALVLFEEGRPLGAAVVPK